MKEYLMPNEQGYFGEFGGQYVPETLVFALEELDKALKLYIDSTEFTNDYTQLLSEYVGRPSPLYFARSLSKKYNAKIYLKREDLNHTGSHKINNAIGQALLAKKIGKKRIIAETGAGQHGVATATASALLNLECCIYMGKEDIKRQKLNAYRIELLGAKLIPVESGSKTLKDALNEALRDWTTNVKNTHYIIGSVAGPHPFPKLVRNFQKIIGIETKKQILQQENKLPDRLIACVGGGSNAMGLFYPFIKDNAKMYGIEAGGKELKKHKHAATLCFGKPGVLHGSKNYLLFDENGQIEPVHSIAPGLDYPGVGPEHSYLKDIKRVQYDWVSDKEALNAFYELAKLEGIIPALESAHAVAYLNKLNIKKQEIIIINLSGRGDKDIFITETRKTAKNIIHN